MQMHVFRDGVRLGNFSPDEAPELLKTGKLLPTDLVQREGGLVPLSAAMRDGASVAEASPRGFSQRVHYSELQVYEKIRIAVETPLCSFLKPYQIGPESSSELNLFRMDDFLPSFVVAANKFTDTCCQNLVKVIRASSESPSIRETPTPELAKRIRDTAFQKLDEILGSVNSAAKKVEVLHSNVAKLKEEVERSQALETIGIENKPKSSGTGGEAPKDPLAAVDEENVRLVKAKMGAFAKIIEYLKALAHAPDAAVSYAVGKCFGADVNYELEREQLAEIKKQVGGMISTAIHAFERVAGTEQNRLEDYKSRVATAKEESLYFSMLQQALEEKMEGREKSAKRFRKALIIAVMVGLTFLFIMFMIIAYRVGLFSTKVQ